MEDKDLLQQYRQTRSAEIFRRLMDRYFDLVQGVALRHARDSHLADDVCQAVFITLSRNVARLHSDTALAPWLICVTRNAAVDAVRGEMRRESREQKAARINSRPEIIHPSEADAQTTEREAKLSRLESALTRLATKDREVIVLKFLQGRTHERLGHELGISAEAAKKRLSRAMFRLREIMGSSAFAASFADPQSLHDCFIHPIHSEARAAGLQSFANPTNVTPRVQSLVKQSQMRLARGVLLRSPLRLSTLLLAIVLIALVFWKYTPFLDSLRSYISPHALVTWTVGPPSPSGIIDNHIAPGWPIILPGSVTGAPIDADLLGDGQREIIVPCMAGVSYGAGVTLLHPSPESTPLLFAFHVDGRVVQGWPVVLGTTRARRQANVGSAGQDWLSNPAVVRLPGAKGDSIVITSPEEGTFRVDGDATLHRLSSQGAANATAVIANLDAAGNQAILLGSVRTTVLGTVPQGWTNALPGAYSPCVGTSINGTTRIFIAPSSGPGAIAGFDSSGQALKGWPRPISIRAAVPPVMGDLDNDGIDKVCALDHRGHLLVWNADGTPARGTNVVDGVAAVLKQSLFWRSPLSLADIDATGRAAILHFDPETRVLHGWHDDGTSTLFSDGIICRLPNTLCLGGITAARFDDDLADLFIGTSWVRIDARRQVEVRELIPGSPHVAAQCTLANFNGNAHVLLGLTDGRVFVYQTRKRYDAAGAQWSTAGANAHHTGFWAAPAPRPSAVISTP